MEINTDALAVACGEIEVAASPEMVWRVLTDIASWPSWNPDVKSTSLEGAVATGTKFRWIHHLELQDGRTIVKSAESWEGPPVRLLRRSMGKSLQKAIDLGLRHLQIEVERQATKTGAT